MSDVTRWLTWTPKGKTGSPILEKTLEGGLPKVPKPISGTFGIATPSLFQKIGRPERKPERVPGAIDLTGPEMAREVCRWIAMRCAVPKNPARVWASEKSLYRDYGEWCHESGQAAVPQEQFTGILSELFRRDADGWQGLCLAVDWAATMATERIQ